MDGAGKPKKKIETRWVDNITQHVVMSADTAARQSDVRAHDIYSRAVPGLLIRVGQRSAAWYVRGRLAGKQRFWRIADLKRDDDPKEMRLRAGEARNLAARGVDPADWLKEQALGGVVYDHKKDGWTWAQGADAFLEYIKEHKSDATFRDYRPTLKGKWCKRWNNRLLKSMTKTDFKALQDEINDAGFHAQAARTLRVIKSFMKWASDRAYSGIEESVAASVRPLDTGNQRMQRVPLADEVGLLPWQLESTPMLPAFRLSALLVLLTLQRRESVISASIEDFYTDEEYPQYGLIWRVEHTKRKRKPGEPGHYIPLPPPAAAAAKLAIAAAGASSGFLFPQTRLRNAGDSGDGHMAPHTPTNAMKKTGSLVRSHDLRRIFTKVVEEDLGFTRMETQLILDHEEGQAGNVTKVHYAPHAQLRLKAPIITGWNTWAMEQIARCRPEGVKARLPAALAGVLDEVKI